MPVRYDDKFVKRPRAEVEYTPEMIRELQKCREDVGYFLKYVKIVNPDKGEIYFKPYDYQFKLLKRFQKHRFNIAMCTRQSGKALSLDTPIPMPNAQWTTIGDIKVGDIILGKNGKPTEVIFVTPTMKNHNCYEIEFDNGEKIVSDEEHLWKIGSSEFSKRQGKDKPISRHLEKILTTKELLEKYNQFQNYKTPSSLYINYHKPIENDDVDLPLHPYLIGMWLGDGNSYDSRITTNVEDYDEISQYLIENGYEVSEFRPDKRRPKTGAFNIYNIIGILRELNLLKNKHIPDIYLKSSIEQRLELIRGLMDSDGYCKSKNGACEFSQKDYNITTQFRELLSSLGIKSRIRDKKIDGEKYYTVSFSTSQYFVFNLKRKRINQSYCDNHPKNKRIYIKNIREVESVPVRCIQVDNDDKLFLCGKTMIPTHNTTIVSAYVLWYAIFHKDKNIGIVSNKESSAKMILGRLKRMYESLPSWLKPGVTEYSKTFTTFDNNSRIVISATSPDAFRGETINLLCCDEFAFVPSVAAEDFWAANYPTISASKEAKIIIISTPNGLFNIFHTLWTQAKSKINTFITTRVSWEDVPGRDEEWAKEQMKNLGMQKFNQEFAVKFIGSTNTVLSSNCIKVLLSSWSEPKFMDLKDRLRIFEKPQENAAYIMGVDPAKGTGENWSTIQVFRIDSLNPVKMEQVAVFEHNLTDVYEFTDIVDRVCYYYNNAYIMCENNGEGSAVINRLWWELENENLVNSGSKEINLGIRATRATKPKAILLWKKLTEDGSIEYHDKNTIEQFGSFIEENNKFFGKDKPDDLVSACYWAPYLFEMDILDETYGFIKKKDEDDGWGILADIETESEDWSWLTETEVFG